MAVSLTGVLLEVGQPEDLAAPTFRGEDTSREYEPARATRGLVLKELTLNRGHEGIASLFGARDEVYFISTAMDFSGTEPTVFPGAAAEASVVPLRAGETLAFTLGEGAPIFPEREITSGIAVLIHVLDSDGGVVAAGKAMEAAADAIKTDGKLVEVLKKLIKNPGQLAADVVLGAVLEVGKVVGTVLQQNQSNNVAFFQGYFPAEGSWEGKLRADQRGASITLGELPTPSRGSGRFVPSS